MSTMDRATLAERLRAVKMCRDEPDQCGVESGPYCDRHDFAEYYVPLMREAADALAAMAWQPMDTAPKDVPVLVWCSHGQYVATLDERIHGAGIYGWSVDDNKHGPYALRGASPTRWMPLPPGPARERGETR